MKGTDEASKSTDWVADSLAKLGDSVSKSLRDREQQRQAQEMLPVIQQSFKDAMTYANEGDAGLAYSKLMQFITDPATANNPYIKQVIPAFENGIKFAAENYVRKIKAGGGGDGPSITNIIDAMNQGADGDEYVETEEVQQAAVGPANAMRLRAADQASGFPAMQDQYSRAAASGQPFPFKTARDESAQAMGTGQQPLQGTPEQKAMQAQDMNAYLVGPPLPGEGEAPLAKGPVAEKTPPPPDITKKFIKYTDQFAKMPIREQIEDRDKSSIMFRTQGALDKYIGEKKKGRQILDVSPQSGLAVPGVIGVELPDEISKFVLAGATVGNKVSYRIDEKIKGSAKAKAAVDWLNTWQETAVGLESSPEIRNLFEQAGNDALNIDTSSKPKGYGPTEYILQVRGNPNTAIKVDKDTFDKVQILRTQTAAAKTHGAKFIRVEQPKSQIATAASEYKSAEDVRSAVKSGRLTREQAMGILKSQFGYQ
jgi:hypothetical protein